MSAPMLKLHEYVDELEQVLDWILEHEEQIVAAGVNSSSPRVVQPYRSDGRGATNEAGCRTDACSVGPGAVGLEPRQAPE